MRLLIYPHNESMDISHNKFCSEKILYTNKIIQIVRNFITSMYWFDFIGISYIGVLSFAL